MNKDIEIYGAIGTILSATGASISVTELQAIISIIVTVLGFIISVLIPVILRIVKKVKEAKADGVITEEEKKEILQEIKEDSKIVKDGVEELKKDIEESKNK